MKLAPIVLFVYNRPWHTAETLRALRHNDFADRSILYVYGDAPKHLASEADVEKVEEVKRLVKCEQWCKEVHLIVAVRNKGQVQSFVDGITEVVNKHGRAIVLEDDQVTSRGFLKYMNEALEIYKDDPEVMHISGYMYPAKVTCKDTTFFLQVQSCPGWGTWKRAWDLYNHDAADHLRYFSATRKRRRKFDIEGHAYYFRQLERNAGSELYSWAVRWHASCIRAGGLSLFPAKSLVQNIGCDATGVHCGDTDMYQVETVDYLDVYRVPIIENKEIRKRVDRFYKESLGRGFFRGRRIMRGVRGVVMGLFGLARKPLRMLVRIAYPEFQQLDPELAKRLGLMSSAADSRIDKRAHLVRPYHLSKCKVGAYTYISQNSWISNVQIGACCSIGPGFRAGWGIHPVDGISTSPMFYSTRAPGGMSISPINKCVERREISIGNDVFIGMNVTVLDGVSIGDGAVVGAGCVVSKDVPPYAIAVGCPMKILRYRFDEETRAALLRIRWWEWPEERLQEVERMFFEVEEFVKRHGVGTTDNTDGTDEED